MYETQARIAECLVFAGRSTEAVAVESLVRVRREATTSVLEAQLERILGWCAQQQGDPEAARTHIQASRRVGRELGAGFEVALSLRTGLALPVASAAEHALDEHEAASILARPGRDRRPGPRAPGEDNGTAPVGPPLTTPVRREQYTPHQHPRVDQALRRQRHCRQSAAPGC